MQFGGIEGSNRLYLMSARVIPCGGLSLVTAYSKHAIRIMSKLPPFPVAREGWPFVALFAFATIILWYISLPLGWLGLILTGWCVYFFRDPERVPPNARKLLVSPADGKVLPIRRASPPPEIGMGEAPRQRVSIFMNVFDVHVNRLPVDGRVTNMAYHRGQFLNASFDKSSDLNERQSIRIATAGGGDIAVVQIAGLIARRIVCRLEKGEECSIGERFGLIRFGSRVDVYLGDDMVPLVTPGQRVVGGETVIARCLTSREKKQSGE